MSSETERYVLTKRSGKKPYDEWYEWDAATGCVWLRLYDGTLRLQTHLGWMHLSGSVPHEESNYRFDRIRHADCVDAVSSKQPDVASLLADVEALRAECRAWRDVFDCPPSTAMTTVARERLAVARVLTNSTPGAMEGA